MKSAVLSLLTLGVDGFAMAAAQDPPRPTGNEQAAQLPLPPVPSSVKDPQGGVTSPPEAAVRPVGNGGAVASIEVRLDDSVPLPTKAVVAIGPDADHVVSGPSGDPGFHS